MFPGASDKVLLWNTETDIVTEGQSYPTNPFRFDAQGVVISEDTILFGGGENEDSTLYLYTAADGFTPFAPISSTVTGGTGSRESFIMVKIPGNEVLQCAS